MSMQRFEGRVANVVGASLVVDGGVTCGTGHPDMLELFGRPAKEQLSSAVPRG
jgi:hypothetical protein